MHATQGFENENDSMILGNEDFQLSDRDGEVLKGSSSRRHEGRVLSR